MEKIPDNILAQWAKEDLAGLASNLPEFAPLKPGGDVSVREMCPDLTEEELDYVMSKYTGTLERG